MPASFGDEHWAPKNRRLGICAFPCCMLGYSCLKYCVVLELEMCCMSSNLPYICRFLNLDIFSSGGRNATTTLQPAGATLPKRNLASGANQCSFATEPQRAMRRGGQFIATIADLPQASVYVSPSSFANLGYPDYNSTLSEFASWRADLWCTKEGIQL